MQSDISQDHSSTGDTTILTTGIHRHPTQQSWLLITEKSAYALGVTEEGWVLNLYWGARLASFAGLPASQISHGRSSQEPRLTLSNEEYPAFGGLRYGEIAAKATFADQTRDLDLRFARAEIGEQNDLPELLVELHDAVYPLSVRLSYRIDPANDLIIRAARFTNTGTDAIVLERAFSAAWILPRQFAPRQLTTLAGQWAAETRVQRQPIVAGTAMIESRKGIPGTNAYPWFALDTQASEQQGEVYFGTLAWSGSWTLHITTDIRGTTTIAGGFHDYDFAWRLGRYERYASSPASLRAQASPAQTSISGTSASALQLVGGNVLRCHRRGTE